MNHKADVGPVNAHAKSDSCHHNLDFITIKGLLIAAACLAVESGMIRQGLDSLPLQPSGGLFDIGAAQTIDNPGLIGMIAHDHLNLNVRLVAKLHLIKKIGSIKGGASHQRLVQRQTADNILLNTMGCGCGKGGDLQARQFLFQAGECQIIRRKSWPH